jgi:hypothetical protein
LSKEEKLRLGNRFMKHLSILAQPDNPQQGLRQVVGMIESGRSLVELGLQDDWSSLFDDPSVQRPPANVYDLAGKPTSLPIIGDIL